MGRAFATATCLGLLLALVPTALGQFSVGSQVGTAAGLDADQQGLRPYAGLTSGEVYVDPVLIDAYRVSVSQIVIAVVEETHYRDAEQALVDLAIPFHAYDQLHMFSLLLPRDLLSDVTGIPGLVVLFHNERMHPALDHSASYTGATVVWNTYHVRGDGVTVMIVDSGVDGTHPDVKLGDNLVQNVKPLLSGNGLLAAQSLENQALTDFDGHGTHVASIVGGLGKASNPGKYRGIAYGAKLVGFAAGLEDPQSGEVTFESQTVLEAFNYAIANADKYKIKVVSNSWGANGDFEPRSPINIASLQMYKAGLTVTFAAGNEGEEGSHTLNKYSVAPWVLAVSAGDYLNKLASFSSRGTDPASSTLAYDHPDIMAPGVGITAARSSIGLAVTTDYYTSKSGTSMACPHVSGIAALLLAANPNLSPDDVMDILVATSTPLTGYDVWESGAGYVNALKAYQLAVKTPGSRDAFVQDHRVKYAGPDSGDAAFAKDPVSVGFGEGTANQLSSGSQSIDEFASELFMSVQGWVFIAGLVVLTPLTFRFRSSQ